MGYKTLKEMNGKSVFIHAVKKGWINKDVVKKLVVKKVYIKGSWGLMTVSKNGQTILPLPFTFKKENDEWRFDLISLMKKVNPLFEQMIKQEGLSKEEFLLQAIRSSDVASKKTVTEDIWNPLKK